MAESSSRLEPKTMQKNRSKTGLNLRTIKQWAELVRDIGVIIGIPILFVVGMKLYDKQIEAIKAENEAIKAQIKIHEITQYDKALSIIEGQKSYLRRKKKFLYHRLQF